MVHFPKSLDFASSTVGMVYADRPQHGIECRRWRSNAGISTQNAKRPGVGHGYSRRAGGHQAGSRGKGRTSFDDVAVVVCFLALIGIAVLGGALMLLSWITATVPVDPRIACSELDDCAVTASDKNDAVLVDDDWIYGPKLTR